MRLDPVSLKLFVSIVETGTIAAAAAEREHVAGSAVSRRISDLEAALKTTLLRRTNKGVEPTDAGIALLNLARGVLHSLDEIAAQMAEYSTGVRGQVRVAANLSAITQFLPGEIKQFLALHPQVQIHLEELISTRVTKAVAENQADIGIFAHVPYGQEVETFRYRSDHLVLIAPRDHPLAGRDAVHFADTLDYDCVGLHTGRAVYRAADRRHRRRRAVDAEHLDAEVLRSREAHDGQRPRLHRLRGRDEQEDLGRPAARHPQRAHRGDEGDDEVRE